MATPKTFDGALYFSGFCLAGFKEIILALMLFYIVQTTEDNLA